MEASHSYYDLEASVSRINEILVGADAAYEDQACIPSREKLTFTNGYYVDITVVFIDMRRSSSLVEAHTRPVLAKIYRAYISEVVAVLRSHSRISEIYIEGDGVWAVLDTQKKSEVDEAVEVAGRLASLVDVLNVKLREKGYSEIRAGISVSDGSSLYIKAGYKGSGINEVVWIGKTVGEAANLCKRAGKGLNERVQISAVVYSNLKDDYKKLFFWNKALECYEGDIYNVLMKEWVRENG